MERVKVKGLGWKLGGILVLLVIIVIGFTTPLAPGVVSVQPALITQPGAVELAVTGYNTSFKSASPLHMWLVNLEDGDTLCPTSVEVTSEVSARVIFSNGVYVHPGEEASTYVLVASNTEDGIIFLRSAVTTVVAPADVVKPLVNDECIVPHAAKGAFNFPNKEILGESIRNLFFHVPMWFTMIGLFLISVVYAIRYLLYKNLEADAVSLQFVRVGLVFGFLGLTTGMLWAQYTWGAFWSGDVKQNMSAILLAIYLAYIVLRTSVNDVVQRARISSVYNIFAAASIIPLLFILPRMEQSLHPGSGGNPGFNAYDLDNHMRLLFYPAVIAWFLIGLWISRLSSRFALLEVKRALAGKRIG